MSLNLDWHIDNDEGDGPWEPLAPRRPDGLRRRQPREPLRVRLARRRALLIALAALAVIAAAAAGWAVWRAASNQSSQRADVLRLARFEDDIIRSGDREAAQALQDPNDPAWGEWRAWLDLGRRHTLEGDDGTPSLGATLAAATWTGASEYGEVRVELGAAALAVTRTYTSTTQGVPAVFRLRQTQYYRLMTDGGWVRTAPPQSVWSTVIRSTGAFVTVVYPPQDAQVVEALIPRLASVAAQACDDLGCNGPPRLILSALPKDLISPSAEGSAAILAPAPALVGAPADAAGAEALYQLYATRLTVGIAMRAAGAHRVASWDWIQWELARLGLRSDMPATDLQAAARLALESGTDPLDAGMRASYPQATDPGVWLALDFLSQPGIAALRDIVNLGSGTSVIDQLALLTAGRRPDWWAYLEKVGAPDAAYPGDAQLAVVCQGQAKLWDAATGALLPLGAAAGSVQWSPDGQRLILQPSGADAKSFTILSLSGAAVRYGEQHALAWAPDGRELAIQNGANRFLWRLDAPEARMLDNLAAGPGWVGWSPDGRHLAYAVHAQDPHIYVAGPAGAGPQSIGIGTLGAWSNDSRYLAFVNTAASMPPLEVYDTTTGEVLTAVTRTLGVVYALAWAPGDVQEIAVGARTLEHHDAYGEVTIVDLEGHVQYRWIMEGTPFDLAWAPRGDALAWAALGDAGTGAEIFVGRLADETVRRVETSASPLYMLDWGWSPDGRWLAADRYGVTVWSSDFAVERSLPASCHAPAWRPERGGATAGG